MPHSAIDPGKQWRLPPLILHPFSDASGPDKLADCSRASLMLQGLLPNDQFTREELNRRMLDGRFYEIRMLYYVGKDLNRWIEQCMEFVSRDETLRNTEIRSESFAGLLVDDPPQAMKEKLQSWGVMDYKTIFSRALGLNTIFADCPPRQVLSEDFIRYHYRYADLLFQCRQERAQYAKIRSANFHFQMYASGEYTRLLEREWETG